MVKKMYKHNGSTTYNNLNTFFFILIYIHIIKNYSSEKNLSL